MYFFHTAPRDQSNPILSALGHNRHTTLQLHWECLMHHQRHVEWDILLDNLNI